MVSKSSDSSKSRKSHGEQASGDLKNLTYKINQLKKEIQVERVALIREKVEMNRKNLEGHVSQLVSLAISRTDDLNMESIGSGNMLSSRIKSPICILNGVSQGSGDKDSSITPEVAISMSAKLPLIEKIPPYTTWIFLDRNQRMAEDQSVVGRRRIYYDQHDSEALICSDSEEEIADPEEDKHEFSEAEERILRVVYQDYELSEDVLEVLTQSIGGTTSEIQEFYNVLKTKDEEKCNVSVSADVGHDRSMLLDKSLTASLDSLDNLFCRRCLVFDCRLHGYSQSIITPSERQFYPLESEEDKKPCGKHCYLQLQAANISPENQDALSRSKDQILEEECVLEVSINTAESGKRKLLKEMTPMVEGQKLVSVDLEDSASKKQKIMSALDTVPMEIDSGQAVDDSSSDQSMDMRDSASNKPELQMTAINATTEDVQLCDIEGCAEVSVSEPKIESKIGDEHITCQWKPLEKELYLKGLEIFGRNSCLIARNLLSGLKTCVEVSSYMYDGRTALSQRSSASGSNIYNIGKAGADQKDQEMPSRSRLLRRRGRTRKLKYSWKSAGHPSIWRRIADGKNQSCKQYIPCGCKSMCGKQCPCLENGTCCEKYCVCSKSCKNRFRGCHCAKSQCRSRQCPCFAAGRECDPDVCRNCWVSCGDGSLGEPPRRGDGQCGNMRLLLRQQQRILLAKSDVAGWGAFLKNSVNKNDYLGEYTGELISHREADKRGKIYDRTNSSFLFDLNDQYVLDAYRKGDKLKFANHSSNPNCYAKVMLVAGDHRVGIFANEHIEASEELFYDYRYGPDQAPIWARKPDGSRGDDYPAHQGRAKKHQSHR